jgi:hypothetical protein
MTCDGNGNCGACTAGLACTGNPNPCYTGITSCTTGPMVCNNNTQKPAGSVCGLNMVCNVAGACGACTAGLACITNPSACKSGVTSCATGAQTCIDGATKTNGTGCNDGNACTYGDVCTNGTCSGSSYTCTPSDCQTASVCDGAGGCITSNKPDGTACAAGQCSCCLCAGPSSCMGGLCIATGACCNTPTCCTL